MQPQVFRRCPKGTEQRGPGQLCLPKETKGESASPTTTTTTTTTKTPRFQPTLKNTRKPSPSSRAIEAAVTTSTRSNQLGTSFTPRPLKKTATQLSPAQMEDARLVAVSYYINREMGGPHVPFDFDGTSTLALNGLEDYRMVNELSTKDYIVVTRGQETKIVFRGKAGDGDIPHVQQTIRGITRDYSELDTLYQTLAKRNPGGEIEIVSYSNGTPKGMYLSAKYNLKHTAIDGLFGPKETQLLINRPPGAAALELIKTTDVGVSSPAINSARVALGREITNTTLTEIAPVKTDRMAIAEPTSYDQFVEQHSLENYKGNRPGERVPDGLRTRNAAGNLAAGIIPDLIANILVEKLAPEDQGDETKLAEKAITTSGLTRVISPLVGAGAVGVTESLLPVYAGMQAGDKTTKAVDEALPESTPATVRGAVTGGVSGAAGGLGFGVAAAGQRLAGQAIAQGAARLAAPATYTAVATSEMPVAAASVATRAGGYFAVATSEEAALVGEGLVTAEEIGLGAAALAGAETGALLSAELGPLALLGGAIGAGVGLLTAALTSG